MNISHYQISRGWNPNLKEYYFTLTLQDTPVLQHLVSETLSNVSIYICDRMPEAKALSRFIPWWDKDNNKWSNLADQYGDLRCLWCIWTCSRLSSKAYQWAYDSSVTTNVTLTMDQVTSLARTNTWLADRLANLEQDTQEMLDG